jgi:hypothetical protein
LPKGSPKGFAKRLAKRLCQKALPKALPKGEALLSGRLFGNDRPFDVDTGTENNEAPEADPHYVFAFDDHMLMPNPWNNRAKYCRPRKKKEHRRRLPPKHSPVRPVQTFFRNLFSYVSNGFWILSNSREGV